MNKLEVKKSKTVTNTVSIEFSQAQVEEMVIAAVEKEDRKLKDYRLKCTIIWDVDETGERHGFSCVVGGTKTTGGEPQE